MSRNRSNCRQIKLLSILSKWVANISALLSTIIMLVLATLTMVRGQFSSQFFSE